MKIFSKINKSYLTLLINFESLARSDPISCFSINIYNSKNFVLQYGWESFRIHYGWKNFRVSRFSSYPN